jgi:nucleotide-binding universal stress UspA family protein
MYHVLMPVDEKVERARRQAAYVAALPGSDDIEASVLHAWTGDLDHVPEDAVGTQTIDNVESVRVVVDELDAHDISCNLVDGAGDPFELVLSVVEDENPDQVVMSRGKQSPVGKAVFGSVTQRVMLNVAIPVVVVSPDER